MVTHTFAPQRAKGEAKLPPLTPAQAAAKQAEIVAIAHRALEMAMAADAPETAHIGFLLRRAESELLAAERAAASHAAVWRFIESHRCTPNCKHRPLPERSHA